MQYLSKVLEEAGTDKAVNNVLSCKTSHKVDFLFFADVIHALQHSFKSLFTI